MKTTAPTEAVGCTLVGGGEGKVVECPVGVARGREVGRPVRREVVLPVAVRSAEGGREPIGVAKYLRGSWI